MYGNNIDYLLASLVHDDPRLKELAEYGQASFDDAVKEFLAKGFVSPKI